MKKAKQDITAYLDGREVKIKKGDRVDARFAALYPEHVIEAPEPKKGAEK